MLKAAGIVLILTGAVGFGRYLSVSLGRYVSQLIECREIFVQMDAGREYLRLPYAQLLKRTAKGKEKLFAEILTEVADEMEKNKEADAGMLWRFAKENERFCSEKKNRRFFCRWQEAFCWRRIIRRLPKSILCSLRIRSNEQWRKKRRSRNYMVQSAFCSVCFW